MRPVLSTNALNGSAQLTQDTPSLVISATCVRDSGRFVLWQLAPCGFSDRTVRRSPQAPPFTDCHEPRQRHQLDYMIRWSELREVKKTDASSAPPELAEVDATSCTLSQVEMQAVVQTSAPSCAKPTHE